MAAELMDEYMDGTMENDEAFPCKGCGEILEEGKAFELAGNRWHLDCFRCNTCSTLLDSDANLLLLGDGSLICNNCTYSCTACNNKIEDLAILTGDQAFCATCFRCRNCKRKIENLRYARTSQGIFCMSCHESLMARRKKRSRAAAQAKAREKDTSPMVIEKSLPALPPAAIPPNAFADEPDEPDEPESDMPTELSPRPRQAYRRNDSSSRHSYRPDPSPERTAPDSTQKESLNLPRTTYRNNRNSRIFMPPGGDGSSNDPETFFIPVALDPSPVISPAAKSVSDSRSTSDKEYFGTERLSSPEVKADSQASTPHIAFQEKGRQHSDQDSTKFRAPTRRSSKSSRTDSSGTAPPKTSISADDRPPRTSSKALHSSEDFKLQDPPRGKKVQASRTSSQSSSGQETGSPATSGNTNSNAQMDNLQIHLDTSSTPRSSQDSRKRSGEEIRHRPDSLRHDMSPQISKPVARKELPMGASRHANKQHAAPTSAADDAPKTKNASHAPRNTYMQPRQAPAPPPHPVPTTVQIDPISGEAISPKLRWSAGGEFSMDEDMARILGTDEGSSNLLRRVSNVVRHGRSESEYNQFQGRGHARSVSETTRTTASPRWPRTPTAEDVINGHSRDMSNPMSLSSPGQDQAFLKRQLRSSENRVAELERQFNTEKDLVHLNKKLVEKRKTVSVLDTQTEIMIRQLEVLAGYVERAKQTKTPVDPRELEDPAIKDFVQKLDTVKHSMAASIEQLHRERDELVDEKNRAMADRDKALLEFEQLSSKNAQLADMNNDLTHQIQERFKSQIGGELKVGNGLGIYPQRGSSVSALASDAASINTATTMVPHDHEEPIVESGPTVVNIRKGQVKKFNWKKGSKSLAQNVSKGVNRAVGAFQEQRERHPHHGGGGGGGLGGGGLTGDSIGLPYNMTVSQVDQMPSPHVQHAQVGPYNTPGGGGGARQMGEQRQGFGFFGKRGANSSSNSSNNGNAMLKSASLTNVTMAPVPEASAVLFGSDLSDRADFEGRQIPTVVSRCIEEVELRGMDVEGIYRKTGGTSLVKIVQDGFERAEEDYDISDPDIDITAVTSVLKQYFRKLPNPLVTFEVYEGILESNAIADETDRCDHLRRTFGAMPQSHQDCLEFLMFHLTRVAQREPENLMSPKNLAVVFAPTIMRDHSLEREMTDMHAKNIAVQFVIENTDSIFID